MNMTNDQMYPFFRQNADPGGLCQDYSGIPPSCGSYCVAFTGYPPQTRQPYQHVAQGQTVFPAPLGM